MDISDRDFDRLRRYVQELCGLRVPDEKRYLITHRLAPLRKSLGCASWDEFHARLARGSDQDLLDQVIEAMTTNETSFFRDRLPFDSFKEHLLPELVRVAKGGRPETGGRRRDPVRIWCAAASTGQEPYTMAMLIHDHLRLHKHPGLTVHDFSILATDISDKVLEQARKAQYSSLEMRRGLPEYYWRFFRQEGERWRLGAEIRDMVELRRLNLIRPFADLGRFHFISSRNVLIYFDDDTRRRIMDRYYDMLLPGGHLLLGASEGLYGLARRFDAVQLGKSLYYRKPADVV